MQQLVKEILERAYAIATRVSLEAVQSGDGFEACNRELRNCSHAMTGWVQESAPDEECREWFELGTELPHGNWIDPANHMPSQARPAGVARWELNNGHRVEELLDMLKLPINRCMREPREGELPPELFADVPSTYQWGWCNIEAGMHELATLSSPGIAVNSSAINLARHSGSQGELSDEPHVSRADDPITLRQMARLVEKSVKTLYNRKVTQRFPAQITSNVWSYLAVRPICERSGPIRRTGSQKATATR